MQNRVGLHPSSSNSTSTPSTISAAARAESTGASVNPLCAAHTYNDVPLQPTAGKPSSGRTRWVCVVPLSANWPMCGSQLAARRCSPWPASPVWTSVHGVASPPSPSGLPRRSPPMAQRPLGCCKQWTPLSASTKMGPMRTAPSGKSAVWASTPGESRIGTTAPSDALASPVPATRATTSARSSHPLPPASTIRTPAARPSSTNTDSTAVPHRKSAPASSAATRTAATAARGSEKPSSGYAWKCTPPSAHPAAAASKGSQVVAPAAAMSSSTA
mmetsp:Transcript_47578/g.107227  ORF Transcript_47578/g.107227 Transcript_47578/m.107227 type:complete len:273 (-) Transcript_47578:280-1098(-)